MESESWLICNLCCSSTATGAIPPRAREGIVWRKFCQRLLQQGSWIGGGAGGGKGGKRTPPNNTAWKVCQGCFPLIGRAMEIRTRCEEMGARVNQLQLEEDVNEMKLLGEGMTQYYVEMKGVEGLVRGSEEKYASMDNLRRSEKALTQAQEEEVCSIKFLRRRILEVVKQLQGYLRALNVKLGASGVQIGNLELAMLEEAEGNIPDEVETENDNWDPFRSSYGDPGSGMTADGQVVAWVPNSLIPGRSENPPKRRRTLRRRKAPSTKDRIRDMDMEVEGLDFDGATIPPLKEYFILRALTEQKNKREAKEDTGMEGESSTSKYSLEYDPSTGKLSFGGFELIIDEEAKITRCGAPECNFQGRWADSQTLKGNEEQRLAKMERGVKDHILGVHLGTFPFPCPHCLPVRTYKTKKLLVGHIFGVHRPTECDVCARPIKSSSCMSYHKWTHMNEEERAEALRNGQKDPRKSRMHHKDKLTNLRLPCSSCGKQFRTRRDLRKHEQRHSAQRDTVVCPGCGKTYPRHKLHNCSGSSDPETKRKIKCLHCPTMLAEASIPKHTRRFHSAEGDERPHLCFQCGKGFRETSSLNIHMITHGEERPWKCGWGCGKDFKRKGGLRKHHPKCPMARVGETPGLGGGMMEGE